MNTDTNKEYNPQNAGETEPIRIANKITSAVIKTNVNNITPIDEKNSDKTETPSYQQNWGKKRKRILTGRTYRTQHPDKRYRVYVIINDEIDENGKLRPFEIFLQSNRADMHQWMAFAGMSITRNLRHKDNLDEIIEDMKSISDAGNSGYMLKGVNYRSIIAEIGYILEEHIKQTRNADPFNQIELEQLPRTNNIKQQSADFRCPDCGSTTFYRHENCDTCATCGYNKCGE